MTRAFLLALLLILSAILGLTAVPTQANAAELWSSWDGSPDQNRIQATAPGGPLSRSVWTSPVESVGVQGGDPCVIKANGAVYAIRASIDAPSVQTLVALNAASGEQLWETTTTFTASPRPACPAADASHVYVSTTDSVIAFDATDGGKVWEQNLGGGPLPSPVAVNGRVIVGSRALNPANGSTLWTSTSTGVDYPPAVGSGVVVYGGAGARNIAVYNEPDGSSVWFAADPNDGYVHDVAIRAGRVYVAFNTGTVAAYDASTGARAWIASMGFHRFADALVVDDERVYIAAPCATCDVPSRVVALNASNGTTAWTRDTVLQNDGNSGSGSPQILARLGGELWTQSTVLDAATGAVRGQTSFPWNGPGWRSLQPAFADGVVFTWVGTSGPTRRLGALRGAPDADGDLVADSDDNCPAVSNSDQQDLDGDGAGNACDADDDGDGVPDAGDRCPTMPATGTDGCAPLPSLPPAPPATPGDGTLGPTPPSGPVGVSINGGAQYTNDPAVEVSVVWPRGVRTVTLSNDGGFGSASVFGIRPSIPWRLATSGPERLPKTIYVRFDGSTQTFTDDVILDETSPVIASATATAPAAAAAAAAGLRRSYRVRVKASDKTSGVAKLQTATKKNRPDPAVRYRSQATIRSTVAPRFVRVQDRAGNWSAWRNLKRSRVHR